MCWWLQNSIYYVKILPKSYDSDASVFYIKTSYTQSEWSGQISN